jgi:hypothetical protein
MECVRNKHLFSIYHMKHGNVSGEMGVLRLPTPPHTYSFACPGKREELNNEDVKQKL